MAQQNIGFVGTCFVGADGVSLESSKWAKILWDDQHVSHWYSGKSDRESGFSMVVPEAYSGHPEIEDITRQAFGRLTRLSDLTIKINDLAAYLKRTLYDFVDQFSIDILIVENVFSTPVNLPLGIALSHFIVETGFPVIARHHDFYWEQDRFRVNSVSDFLEMAFPPRLPTIQHVTKTSTAQQSLAIQKGLSSTLVPSVLDFDVEPPEIEDFNADFRRRLGVAEEDVFVLLPTRAVPHKGIEQGIRVLGQLGHPHIKLVVTQSTGEEGHEYQSALIRLARNQGVDIRVVDHFVGETRKENPDGSKRYSLRDAYLHADFVIDSNLDEGCGNALLEAFFCRKPVLINRHTLSQRDLELCGFRVLLMDDELTKKLADQFHRVIEDESYRDDMIEWNHAQASRFFSDAVLRRKLRGMVWNLTGQDAL